MSATVYLPPDEFVGHRMPDLDLAADYLELKAVFSDDQQSFSEDIVDTLELAAEIEFDDVDTEMKVREDIAASAVARMMSRKRVLAEDYPFDLDDYGATIFFTAEGTGSWADRLFGVSSIIQPTRPVPIVGWFRHASVTPGGALPPSIFSVFRNGRDCSGNWRASLVFWLSAA